MTRGPKICTNKALLPLVEAEAEVRATFERHLLRPDVVHDALHEAFATLVPNGTDVEAHRLVREQRLRDIEADLGRMTDAIVAGVPKVRELAERMTAKDHERTQVQAELRGLDQLAQAAALDIADVSAKLETILDGWRDPLTGDVAQARQVLRKVLDGRLMFTPFTGTDGAPMYKFTGRGLLDPIVAGTLTALLNDFNNVKRWWPQRDTIRHGDALWRGVPGRNDRLSNRIGILVVGPFRQYSSGPAAIGSSTGLSQAALTRSNTSKIHRISSFRVSLKRVGPSRAQVDSGGGARSECETRPARQRKGAEHPSATMLSAKRQRLSIRLQSQVL